MDYKIILGVLAALISIFSYIPYISDCIKKKTKPNVFTWVVWGIITFIAFIAQLSSGAGAASWVLGVTVIIDFTIVYFSIHNRSKITFVEIVCFILAILAIIVWQLTSNALYAIILVILADALGFFITFRKTYIHPFSETLSTYIFAAIKYIISFLAIETYSPATYSYPIYLVIANTLFVLMVYIKRKTGDGTK